ncbi:MAG TPA: nucleotidyl transferase AbiEii/AbiGii toxin family protein, partial [candidate division Zixibacteria bacterium]|nr:nucleotidyl transferase AbiEii/AbiGii toxin family protein [candidate division Zixibacteria bacterium]
ANSRMKDFYDLEKIFENLELDADRVTEAIKKTFDRRGTALPGSLDIVLGAEFIEAKRDQWLAFVSRIGDTKEGVSSFSDTIATIRSFLDPLIESLAGNELLQGRWHPTSGWTQVL